MTDLVSKFKGGSKVLAKKESTGKRKKTAWWKTGRLPVPNFNKKEKRKKSDAVWGAH